MKLCGALLLSLEGGVGRPLPGQASIERLNRLTEHLRKELHVDSSQMRFAAE